ncbi:hypothetical protein F5Y08DRAFT_349938 [Xylaria arbuscula]|nr:hypothetical protein F5Y08DRAFT_349938 [Xylaria arbuscula]
MDDLTYVYLFYLVAQKWWFSLLDTRGVTPTATRSELRARLELTQRDLDGLMSKFQAEVDRREARAAERRELMAKELLDRERQEKLAEASLGECPMFKNMVKEMQILYGRIDRLDVDNPYEFPRRLEDYTKAALDIQKRFKDMVKPTEEDIFTGEIRLTNAKPAAFQNKLYWIRDEITTRLTEFLEVWQSEDYEERPSRRQAIKRGKKLVKLVASIDPELK